MNRILPQRLRVLLLVTLALLLSVPAVSAETNESELPENPSGDWIIQLNESWAHFQSQHEVASLLGDADHETFGADARTYVASFNGQTNAHDAIARLSEHPAVEFIEPDILYEYQDQFIPNDELFEDQAWAQTVNLPDAWSVSSGNPEVVVAVVDSGIRPDHPDLEGKVVEGRNWVPEPGTDQVDEANTTDVLGHGTAVSGIIGAIGNNETGIAGTAMNVQLMPLRVGSENGAPVSRIAQAVEYAVDNGAKVVNLSLGSETQSATLEQALTYAEENDVIVVAATGNEPDQPSFPGSSQSTISVGATTLDGSAMAPFSSRVSVTDLVAPGVDVLTTFWTPDAGPTYEVVRGTSFSTPIVTGAAALVHSVNPDLDVHQIRALLRETAQMTFAEGTAGTGAGLLDTGAAIREAMLSSYGATWVTADDPVANLETSRTWLWGPYAFDLRTEPYTDAENGQRLVAYYDKARMEVTDPYADRGTGWYVTNGLLVNELISGQMQIGDAEFEQREPAEVPVAGDPVDNDAPTYASFAGLLDAEPAEEGQTIIRTLDREGNVDSDEDFAEYEVTAEEYLPDTDKRIASVFWEYLNSTGTLRQQGQYVQGPIFNPTYFATGFPVTEAYWARVMVGGNERDVLIQCFERRCLTYTPGNDPGWEVEMGNVGQHYYRWRYEKEPGEPVAQDPSSYAMENLR